MGFLGVRFSFFLGVWLKLPSPPPSPLHNCWDWSAQKNAESRFSQKFIVNLLNFNFHLLYLNRISFLFFYSLSPNKVLFSFNHLHFMKYYYYNTFPSFEHSLKRYICPAKLTKYWILKNEFYQKVNDLKRRGKGTKPVLQLPRLKL